MFATAKKKVIVKKTFILDFQAPTDEFTVISSTFIPFLQLMIVEIS